MTVIQYAYNEQELIEFIHSEWKKNFPEAKFTLLNNNSTDFTGEIAEKLGYEIVDYDTGGKFDDGINRELSNSELLKGICAIVDMDEVAQITQEQLEEELNSGVTIIRFEGYNVFNRHESGAIIGTRAPRYDKFIIADFDKVKMNYGVGRHESYPTGDVKYSKKVYKLFHYGLWNEDYYINRRKLYNERWSEKNLQMGWGAEGRKSEEELRNWYRKLKEKAIKII